MSVEFREWMLTALTPIWTGDANRQNERFIPPGLLGSIRWWFEVVARGLGGSVCDPSESQGRCPDTKDRHCVVCELFGCTGWARKFRLLVLDQDRKPQSAAIQKDSTFALRFVPLRPIRAEEWALLDLTLQLIAEYGALGGKTVYKPSDEASRQNQSHHRDYGLVQISQTPTIECRTLDQLRAYANIDGWRRPIHENAAWSSLDHFWCVNGRYLARQNGNQSAFNRVIGRPEPKSRAGQNDSWLAGRRAGHGRDPESRKVFSFKTPQSARRTFGFVQSTVELDKMRERLKEQAWDDLDDGEFVTGGEILRRLVGEGVNA